MSVKCWRSILRRPTVRTAFICHILKGLTCGNTVMENDILITSFFTPLR